MKIITLKVILQVICLIPLNSISYAQTFKKAPDSNILHVIEQGYPSDTRAHIEANIAMLENAIAKYGTKDPWACKAFYILATQDLDLNRNKEALMDLDACLKLPEPYPGIHLAAQQMKMISFIDLQEKRKAIQAANAIINTPGPKQEKEMMVPRAYLLKAGWQSDLSIKNKKMKAESIKTYKQFLSKSKNEKGKDWVQFQPLAIRSLAETLSMAGKKKEAVRTYDEYLRRYPKDPATALVAMEKLSILRGGQNKLTLKDLLSIVSKYPTNSGAGQHVLYQLAYTYYLQNDLKDAIPILRKMLDFTPAKGDKEYARNQTADAGRLLMDIYQRLGNIKMRNAVALEIERRFSDLPESADTKYALQIYKKGDSASEASEREKVLILSSILVFMIIIIVARIVTHKTPKIRYAKKL